MGKVAGRCVCARARFCGFSRLGAAGALGLGREGGCGDEEEGRANDRGGMRQEGYEGGLLPETLLVTTAKEFMYGPNHKGKITGIREEWGKKSVEIKTGRAGVRRA